MPRVAYHAGIRLRSAGTAESFPGRVHNLSSLGAFVSAPDGPLPAVGARIECRLALGGQRRTLAARVAWSRGSSGAGQTAGVGLEFAQLAAEEVQLLERLVESQRAPRLVDVWFEGMDKPARCHAVISGDEIELSTPLAFMRLQSSVRVASGTAKEAEIRLGTLEAVTLQPSGDDGIPRLHLRLSTRALDSAQGTIEVKTAAGPEGAKDATPVPPASAVIDEDMLARVPAWITSGTGAIPRWAPGPTPVIGASRPGSGRFWPAAVTLVATPRIKRGLLWLTGGWRATATGSVAGAVVVAVLWSATTREPGGPQPVPPPGAPRLIQPAATKAGGKSSTEGQNEPGKSPVGPAGAPTGVSLSRNGHTSRLRVELAASTEGARQRRLRDPPGIAVILPRARPRVAAGVHRPGAGVRMEVQPRGQGSMLVFLFDAHTHGATLVVESSAATLELTEKR